MKKYYTIYRIINKINNKIYIGVHETFNLNDNYVGSGKYLKRAINKYGIDNFTKEIIKLCKSREEMFEWEKLTVTKEFIKRTDTYNICEGGKGGFSYINNNKLNGTSKGVKRQKELRKNYDWYEKWYKKKTESQNKYLIDNYKEQSLKIKEGQKKINFCHSTFLGKKHTEESKKKMSLSKKSKYSGKDNSQYGTCWVYNLKLKENKKIPKLDLDIWIEKGYIKGRKMKF